MTSDNVRMLITVSLPCFTVLVGILINNHRIADLQCTMNRRFDDLIRIMEARFQTQDEKLYRVEQVLDARLKYLEGR